nr:MAG TPA: hypothetical protein [Caudoviricetes sp.]
MATVQSSGVAKAGLTTGIIGTSLAGLWALGAGNNGNGGILGGLFGNNGNCGQAMAAMGVLAEKDAKIAELTAQKYSDNQDAVLYQATRSENKALRDELMAFITPLSNEAADNRVRVSVLEAQQKCETEKALLREQLIEAKIDNCCCQMNGKIDTVAQTAACGIAQNSAAIASLQNVVGSITATIIPKSVICPEVMQRYNSWTAPTDTAPATQPISGTVNVTTRNK